MTLHNYRARQVHKILNEVNRSSSFRDMRSAKSGPNLWQIWQVFGPWASLYGANGHMTMTVHTYRPRQFHRTSNGENPSSGYRDMGSASLAAARQPARPPGPWRQYPSSPQGWGVKKNLGIDILIIKENITLQWMLEDLVNGKTNLVQVMAWCCHATSHHLNQHWQRSQTKYGMTCPQWVSSPLCAKFFRGNINIYLHFMSFLHIYMTQVVEILPQARRGPTYST